MFWCPSSLMKYKKRNITIEIDDKTLHINSVS